MRGPEAKLYQKLKKATPKIIWNRIENISVPGMAEALGPCTVKLYEGSVIRDLVACGLELDACCLGLEACSGWFESL
jgi:hypothetical protein